MLLKKIESIHWLVGFYNNSTFIGYSTPNPFLCKYSVLFQTIQFSMSTQFNCQTFLFPAIQFTQAILIWPSISTDFVYTQLNVKTILH